MGGCVSYRFTRLMRSVCGLQFADLLGDRSSVSSLTYRVNLIGFIGVLGSCVRLVGSDCLHCGVAIWRVQVRPDPEAEFRDSAHRRSGRNNLPEHPPERSE